MRKDTINILNTLNESVLNEKINKDNIEINDKIRKSLRSKGEARKNEPEFTKHGIKVDYDKPQGTTLTGPNGRTLSDDKNNVHGPRRPGFNNTHYKSKDAERYEKYSGEYADRIKDLELKLKQLDVMDRDDIIRKYNDKSTDDALAAHEKEKERIKSDIADYSKWANSYKKDALKYRQNANKERRRGHSISSRYDDLEIDKNDGKWSRESGEKGLATADKVDYLNYLTKPKTGYRKDNGNYWDSDSAYDPADDMNKLSRGYKDLQYKERSAKDHLNYQNKYYGVKSDDEMNKQADDIRAKAEKDIEDMKATNEKNKTNVKTAQDDLNKATQAKKDYMNNIRANRNKKNESEEMLKEALVPVSELPDMCYGVLPTDCSIIIIKKGETGYYKTNKDYEREYADITDWNERNDKADEVADRLNAQMDITPEQRQSMEIRSMSGNWSD